MARPSKPTRARKSRKPVTIDLEAQAVDVPQQTQNTSSTNDAPSAEPVAFDNLDKDLSAAASTVAEEVEASVTSDGEVDGNAQEKPSDSPNSAPYVVAQSARGGRTSAFTGGLVGGLLALLGGAGLQWGGVLPNFGGSSSETASVDISPLQAELDAVKNQLAQLDQGNEQAARVPDGLTESVNNATALAQQALSRVEAIQEEASGLREKISVVEGAVSEGGAGENVGLETLSARLTALESQVAESIASNSDGNNMDVTSVLAPTVDRVESLQSQIADFSTQLTQVEESVDARFSSFDGTIAELNSKLGDMASRLSEGDGSASVAKAIAAAGLKSAIDRGGAFMSELEAYATVAQEDSVVSQLRDYAAAGVPTINQLSDGFSSVASQIVATGQGLPEDATVADRLMASARSLVQIRPKGEVEGDTPGAIAARVEARLLSGELDAAIAEFDTLPEAAKATAAEFGRTMRARQTVDLLVSQALTGAMASTAPNSN